MNQWTMETNSSRTRPSLSYPRDSLVPRLQKQNRIVFSGFSAGFCINEEEGYLFRPDDDWSIQSKRRQVIFRAIVGNR